jgi:hypothetical protein
VAAPLRGLRLEDVEDRDAAVLRQVEWADVKCEPLLDRVRRVGKVTVDAEDAVRRGRAVRLHVQGGSGGGVAELAADEGPSDDQIASLAPRGR